MNYCKLKYDQIQILLYYLLFSPSLEMNYMYLQIKTNDSVRLFKLLLYIPVSNYGQVGTLPPFSGSQNEFL